MIEPTAEQVAACHCDVTSWMHVVLAGPGSGKTTALAERYRYLTKECDVLPSQICAITFTRYAADQLRRRIGPSNAMIGTFHHVGLEIVKQLPESRNWDFDRLTVLDEAEEAFLERQVMRDLGILSPKGTFRKGFTWHDWDAYKRFREHPNKQADDDADILLRTVWARLGAELTSSNCMTYDMILHEACAVLEYMGAPPYEHLLLDEAQDCDPLNWRLATMLAPHRWVVGDPDQSIYEWRNAAPVMLTEFAKTTGYFPLRQCHRFGKMIAEVANRLISVNARFDKMPIRPATAKHDEVRFVETWTPDVLIHAAADAGSAVGFGNVAILSRTHATLDELESLFRKVMPEVPIARIGGASDVTTTYEYRVVKAYLKLAVNEYDRQAFAVVAHHERMGAERMAETLADMAGGKPLSMAHDLPKSLCDLRMYLNGSESFLPALSFFETFAHVNALAVSDTAEIVRSIAMSGTQDLMMFAKPDAIRLLTIHAAKGLEWPVVFVAGIGEDFPSRRAVREGRIEEERRLLYVAMTRAVRALHLYGARADRPPLPGNVFWREVIGKGG